MPLPVEKIIKHVVVPIPKRSEPTTKFHDHITLTKCVTQYYATQTSTLELYERRRVQFLTASRVDTLRRQWSRWDPGADPSRVTVTCSTRS